jgi:hypothetical protein
MATETLQRPRTVAIPHDRLRYRVPSARNPREQYLVDIASYNGNGACTCQHFLCRCEPLLRRRVSPKEAVEQNLIKLKVNRHVEDALRCEHCITARSQFVDDILQEISDRTPQKELG